jgi:1-acyl-sn-glycerol-3-phosphate acyltransferase
MGTGFHDEGHGFDEFGLLPSALAGAQRLAAPFYDHYFRVTSFGADLIPTEGPAILVANHAGVLPVDSALLCLDVLRKTERIPRAVSDHFVPRLPLVSTWFARFGVVSGTRANVRRLLERGELIAIWPEGVSGPAKPYRERYKIQHWRVGFAELAIRHRAPVIPVGIVGSEESWPLLARLRGLRAFGAPYLPIPATPVPLPAHYYLRYGTPIPLHLGLEPSAADDPEIVADAADQVKHALEDLMTISLALRPGVFR